MRKITPLICLFIFLLPGFSMAQVGINKADPDTSAILHIHHDSKGILLPGIDDISKVDKVNGTLFYSNVDNKFYYYRESDDSWQCVNPLNSTSPGNIKDNVSFSDDVAINGKTNLNNLSVNGLVQSDLKLQAKKIQITRGSTAMDIIMREDVSSPNVIIGNGSDVLKFQTGANTNLIHRKGSAEHIIWDKSNDGSGSTLDADKLDGKDLDYIEGQINKQANAKTTSMSNKITITKSSSFPSTATFHCNVYHRNGIVFVSGAITLNGNTEYQQGEEMLATIFPNGTKWEPQLSKLYFPISGVQHQGADQSGYGMLIVESGQIKMKLYVWHSDVWGFFNFSYPLVHN